MFLIRGFRGDQDGSEVRASWRAAHLGVGVCLLVCCVSAAQNAVKSGSFEIASLKPSPVDDGSLKITIFGNPQPGGRWTSRNATLVQIIRGSYPGHVLPDQIVGGPDWVRKAWFDISAKAPNADATREELAGMARNLLAERFKLVLRTEMRETSGYALVPSRPGAPSALHRATLDCDSIRTAEIRGDSVPPASVSTCVVRVIQKGPLWKLTAGGIPLTRLAEILTPTAGARVIDATGFNGLFDITLEFSTDSTSTEAVSIFTALQEQLGLRLERRRVPIEVLIIDRAEPPTPD